MTGPALAAAAGLGFGVFQTLNRRAVGGMNDAYLATFIQLLTALGVLVVASLTTENLELLGDATALSLFYFSLAGVIHFSVGWTFLNMSQMRIGAARSSPLLSTTPVFGAVIAYAMQCLSFILLRRNMPNIERPYRSPVGVPGAAVAGIIALVSLAALFLDEAYLPGVYGIAIWFILGLGYFAIVGRHRLVLSPEEEFAMTQGEHGHPETEGYGTTHVADTEA